MVSIEKTVQYIDGTAYEAVTYFGLRTDSKPHGRGQRLVLPGDGHEQDLLLRRRRRDPDRMGCFDMSIDIKSLLMGKALGSGGGGGGKTLWNSGWIKTYGTDAEIDGNVATLKSGSTSHGINIAPPATANRNHRFDAGDVFVIAFTASDLTQYLSVNCENASNATFESATGLVPVASNQRKFNSAGSDVLTITITSGYCGSLVFNPVNSSGSSSSSASAVVEITGMSYNGNLIYGSVTPPSA